MIVIDKLEARKAVNKNDLNMLTRRVGCPRTRFHERGQIVGDAERGNEALPATSYCKPHCTGVQNSITQNKEYSINAEFNAKNKVMAHYSYSGIA